MLSAYVTALPSAALPSAAMLRLDAGASLAALALISAVVLAGLVAACARRERPARPAPLRAPQRAAGPGTSRAA